MRRRLLIPSLVLSVIIAGVVVHRVREARHRAMYARVQRLLDAQRHAEAVALCTSLMRRAHWDGLLVDRAIAYVYLNQYQAARDDLDHAVTHHPTWSAAWANRGDLDYRQKRYDEALKDFTEAIRLHPYAFSYYGRALVYEQRHNSRAAISDYGAAIALEPASCAYERRGRLYARLKQNDCAIDDYTHAIALEPDQGRLYISRAALRTLVKQHQQALEDANKAVALLPDDAWGHLTRGFAYSDLKRHEQALSDFETVVKLQPKWGVGYYWRGWAHDHLGHRGEAKADWQQALLLGDDETTKRARAKLRGLRE